MWRRTVTVTTTTTPLARHWMAAQGLALLATGAAAAPPAASHFDHKSYDVLLGSHVSEGMVDYRAFAAAPSFQTYLNSLDAARPEALAPNERLAYWINVYNAFTIQLINVRGERESIKNIDKFLGLLAVKGPWKVPIVRAARRTLTLDQVEHEIVRKEFSEPRIHFALVCAALSCPPLRREAYTGARLEQQLDDQARQFLLGSPDKNRVALEARIVYVSKIFDWFQKDFGGSRAAVGRFIARYHEPGPVRDLLESGRFSLRTTTYDWTLNSQEQARKRTPQNH